MGREDLRRATTSRTLALAAAVLALSAAFAAAVTHGSSAATGDGAPAASSGDPLVRRGAELFAQSCSACHGARAEGIADRGPSLVGVGAAAIDFQVGTGRMPLDQPEVQASRHAPVVSAAGIRALTAFIGSLGPATGPAIPHVVPERGDLAAGRRLFADRCAGCHQIVGEGGIGVGFQAPSLDRATPTQIGEAVRTGPYVMPSFNSRQLDSHELDSVARFIVAEVRDPRDAGGWGIGHIGPIPEGLFAILLGGLAVVGLARVIGEGRR